MSNAKYRVWLLRDGVKRYITKINYTSVSESETTDSAEQANQWDKRFASQLKAVCGTPCHVEKVKEGEA